MSADLERTLCGITADLLDQGRILNRLSLAFGVTTLFMLLFIDRPVWRLILIASILACVVQTWFAIRTSFDAALFRRLEAAPDVERFDAAMRALALMPAHKAGRPVAARTAGARRLLGLQAGSLLVQILLHLPPVLWFNR